MFAAQVVSSYATNKFFAKQAMEMIRGCAHRNVNTVTKADCPCRVPARSKADCPWRRACGRAPRPQSPRGWPFVDRRVRGAAPARCGRGPGDAAGQRRERFARACMGAA